MTEKREEVLDQQSHIDGGLKKLKETEDQVANLQSGLAEKEKMLTAKNKEAEEPPGAKISKKMLEKTSPLISPML